MQMVVGRCVGRSLPRKDVQGGGFFFWGGGVGSKVDHKEREDDHNSCS
jgi:hypothetical protein